MAILAATDGRGIPDRVVEIGADLAAAYDEALVVVHVLEEESSDGPLPLDSGAYTYDEGVEGGDKDASEKAMIVARNVVDGTLDGGDDADVRGRVGDPEVVILDEAQAIDARYLVVGGDGGRPSARHCSGLRPSPFCSPPISPS